MSEFFPDTMQYAVNYFSRVGFSRLKLFGDQVLIFVNGYTSIETFLRLQYEFPYAEGYQSDWYLVWSTRRISLDKAVIKPAILNKSLLSFVGHVICVTNSNLYVELGSGLSPNTPDNCQKIMCFNCQVSSVLDFA